MRIKNIIICMLASCTLLSSLSLQQNTSSMIGVAADNGLMRDDMTAQEFAYDMGLGINLGNTMESYNASNCESLSYTWPPVIGNNKPQDYETCWGAKITTQKIIDGMKNAGFNTVRIPVFWGNMMENDGKYKISDEYINRVKEIVDYCRNAGLYAVINIHHFDEFIIRRNNKEKSAEIFMNLWTQIANYFKDYSDFLVFEGYNEYLGGGQIDPDTDEIEDMPKSEAYDWTNTMNQAFVEAVRVTGGNNAKRMLVVSGYYTNVDNTISSAFKMPNDTAKDRLMVSVHYVDSNMYWSNQIGSEEWKTYSVSRLELLKKVFYDKGIPVFVGETTAGYDGRFSDDAEITDSSEAVGYMLRLIKGYGFVPVLWDTSDDFYSRTNCKIKSQANEEIIKTLAKELNDGTFTPPETDYLRPMDKDDALGLVYSGKTPITLASGKADASMAGAVKIRYIFDCASDVSFNEWAGIALSATVAGVNSKISASGNSYMTGVTGIEVSLQLNKQIKEGDSYSFYAYTNSWRDAEDYVFLIRCIEFLDADGNVIKTFQKIKPTDPKPSDPDKKLTTATTAKITNKVIPKTTRSKSAVAKDKKSAQKFMKQAKITKLTAKSKAKKKINVSWKKVKKALGYQVQVSAKKNFKKVIFNKKLKKTKLTIKNKKIKSKKIYFVRVRAYATYKDANNKAVKVYSKWNKQTRKVRVK